MNWSTLVKSATIQAKIKAIELTEANSFDSFAKVIKDDWLTLVGKKKKRKQVAGFGGEFTFCTLGEPLDLDKMLCGEFLPDFTTLGSWLFHTSTGEVFLPGGANEETMFLGESSAYYCWLVYKPELDFLKSPEAALTLSLARRIAGSKPKGKKHLVFAPAKYAPNSKLLPLGVEYAPLPFALYRIEKG